ncbi:MAG: putative HNHc nuclease [Caudoviricetes sp.]|nr:MAG: putative HNHc nuclease [Caudoviricetes sp.]
MLARGKDNLVKTKLLDNAKRSIAQNNLSHQLISDIANWYVDDPFRMEQTLKYMYLLRDEYGFSHRYATKDEAISWINFLIEFILREQVPLSKRYHYLLENDSFFYFSCKYRSCCVCGKPNAQIHHLKAIGNRKRKHTDHRKFPMASACYEHHEKAHKLGEKKFIEIYKILPVYLDKEDLIKLGIMSNKQILSFDEKYETEKLFEKATL